MAFFTYQKIGKKLTNKIINPRFVGFFKGKDAKERNLRLVVGKESHIALYWLVDESDGVICDAKFQAFGGPFLIGVCETISEMVLRKNYDQISRFTADLIDQQVRDQKDTPAFPKDVFSVLNLALSAIDRAVSQCMDIPFTVTYETTPIEYDFETIEGGISGWDEFPLEKRQRIVEEVIEKEIRPYVELDAGGIRIVSLNLKGELVIVYEGSCTTCPSSIGSTLTAIQKILNARVHPSLLVVPSF